MKSIVDKIKKAGKTALVTGAALSYAAGCGAGNIPQEAAYNQLGKMIGGKVVNDSTYILDNSSYNMKVKEVTLKNGNIRYQFNLAGFPTNAWVEVTPKGEVVGSQSD